MGEAPGSTSIPGEEGREPGRGASEKGSPAFTEEGGAFTLLTSGREEYNSAKSSDTNVRTVGQQLFTFQGA